MIHTMRISLAEVLGRIDRILPTELGVTSAIYSASYLSALERAQQETIQLVGDALIDLFNPRSALDLGCGTGLLLQVLSTCGVEVLGVDGSSAAGRLFRPGASRFLRADLRKPLELQRTFDLVLAIEVAEHLDEQSVGIFFNTCASHGRTVVLSAAGPQDSGVGHVQGKTEEAWLVLLRSSGLSLQPALTKELRRRCSTCPPWWRRIMVLQPDGTIPSYEGMR